MCHECRIKAGFKPRDNGVHTANEKECSVCKEIRPILPARHWK